MTSDKFLQKVESFSLAEKLFTRGERICAAVSGGADSVALLCALLALAPKYDLTITACHFNHRLRGGESDRDEQFVRALCGALSVPLTVEARGEIDAVGGADSAQATDPREGVAAGCAAVSEGTARRWRYAFFDRVARQGLTVATAHTESDLVETVILNLVRGAGSRGLAGIPPKRGGVIRPLLAVTRGEVEAYLAEQKRLFVQDSTNASVRFSRNRVRLCALPELRKLNAGADRQIAAAARHLREEDRALSAVAEGFVSALRPGEPFPRERFCALAPALRRRVAERLLIELGGEGAPVPAHHTGALLSALERGRGGVNLSGGEILSLYRGRLLRRGAERPAPPPAAIGPGEAVPWGEGIYRLERADLNFVQKLDMTSAFDYDKVMGRLWLRARAPGDRMRPLGRGVTKPLKKLLQEAEVPPWERGELAVLADDLGPVWAERIGAAERVAPAEGGRPVIVRRLNSHSTTQRGERAMAMKVLDGIAKTLIPADKLQERIKELGAKISEDYADKNLLLVSVLKGSIMFMADLMRAIDIPLTVDFMCISSYGAGTKTSGVVKIIKDLDIPLEGYDLLIVEDILDSGKTLEYTREVLGARSPRSIRLCTLLDKPERRQADVEADYVGFVVPDEFVVGYGLDFDEHYRNLDFIGVLKPEIYTE